ncbi:MAG: hypothetical protein KAH09_05015 [Desulfobacula sp.]|nr:hypothetical protein [Desulfobacula sp.]
MDDISRELEREIALSKPKPYKKERKTRILVIDDFGEMNSGDYLKILVWMLSVATMGFCVAAAVFYSLYTKESRGGNLLRDRLVSAERKVDVLTREKELLMAGLVISGKDPEAFFEPIAPPLPLGLKQPGNSSLPAFEERGKSDPPSTVEQQKDRLPSGLKGQTPGASATIEASKAIQKAVSIEKFRVTRDGTNGHLLVRFDIRNVSKAPGEVSGRIFTLLKPDNDLENQWLVIPPATIKNGMPSDYKKGQYFSISHFKPIKFRVKNKVDPDVFKQASIFIFNNQGDLIFDKLIHITAAE